MDTFQPTPVEAFERALWLALTAVTDDQVERATHLAEQLAAGLLPEEIADAQERAKRKAGI